MKGTVIMIAIGTLLLGACSTSDTTTRMYGRDEYKGAEVRADNTVTENDVYQGSTGSAGVIEKRDISQDNRDLNADTYTGASGSSNTGINPAAIPDVSNSTGTGSGTGVPTGTLNNSSANGNNNGTGYGSGTSTW